MKANERGIEMFHCKKSSKKKTVMQKKDGQKSYINDKMTEVFPYH